MRSACAGTLRRGRSEADQVIIEVLETAEEPDLKVLAHAIERWRSAGFQVAMDDAGPPLPYWRR